MLEFKVVADEDVYITQTNTYGPIGESLQASLDQFIDNLLSLVTNGSLEGGIATVLNDYGTKIRESLSKDLTDIMTERGGSSYNFQYYIQEADVFSYEGVALPGTPPGMFPLQSPYQTLSPLQSPLQSPLKPLGK